MATMHDLGHCIHYDPDTWLGKPGTAKGPCDAGVDYATVRIDPPIRVPGTLPIVLPCHSGARGCAEADTCSLRVWPTDEQMAESAAETERMVKAILSGRCPTCGIALQRHSRTNGGGYVESCPAGCGTSVRTCGEGDIGDNVRPMRRPGGEG